MSKPLIDLTRATKPAIEVPSPEEPASLETAPQPQGKASEATPVAANVNNSQSETFIVAPNPVATTATPAEERVSTLGVRIPVSLHQSIRIHCLTHNVEIQEFARLALGEYLAQHSAPMQTEAS